MTARRATTILFFLTGATFASFAARIPALQDRLDLSPGQLSLAFLALNGGAVAGLPGCRAGACWRRGWAVARACGSASRSTRRG
jgi:hypothetical protein